jgi:hypothetical protein
MEKAMSKATAREQLEEIIRGNINIFFQFKNIAKLVSLDLISRMTMGKMRAYKHKHLFEERLKVVMRIIQKGIDQGEFRKVDQMTAASIIYSAVLGLAHSVIFCPPEMAEEMDDSTLADEAVRLIMNGLAL